MTVWIALYDVLVNGELFYVGISRRPKTRLEMHRWTKRVPVGSTVQVVAWFDRASAARKAERERIESLRPPANLMFIEAKGATKRKMALEALVHKMTGEHWARVADENAAKWRAMDQECREWIAANPDHPLVRRIQQKPEN